MKPFFPAHKARPPRLQTWGLLPHAARYLITGHILILVALGEFAARLHSGNPEVFLHTEDFLTSVMGAWVIMWGAGILLDYLERTIETP